MLVSLRRLIDFTLKCSLNSAEFFDVIKVKDNDIFDESRYYLMSV